MEFTGFRDRLAQLIGDTPPFAWAKKIGLPGATFQRMWNEGQPPKANHLSTIKRATGCSIDWLLTGEGPMLGKETNNRELSTSYKGSDALPTKWQSALLKHIDRIIEYEAILRSQTSNPSATPKDPRLCDIEWWLYDFWNKASEEQRIWFIVELKRNFHEFSEWLEEKER